MPEFVYNARGIDGKATSGKLVAADVQDAYSQLSGQKLIPIKVTPAAAGGESLLKRREKVSSVQLANFYSQLADLLRSGVPLLRSLSLIEQQATNEKLKGILNDVRHQVADGKRLAQALGRHPQCFSPLAISLVEAGEEGSFLEDALKRLAMFVQHQNELRGKVTGAMIYPIFVGGFGILTAVVMLVFFVPKFKPIFDRMEAERGLPWATETLMTISDVLQQCWVLLAALAVGLFILAGRVLQSETGRAYLDAILVREYRVGRMKFGLSGIFRNLALARFCRVLGTLLQNGVPMLRSIAIARRATGNRTIEQAIEEASEFISRGKSLAGPLRNSEHFSADVVEMIAVAEESNQLERVLVEVADQLEHRVQSRLEILVRLLEPVMLMGLAAFVLFIVA
ncbi:MAG: type II secretion system F family protein, partial [Planctomycetaceae bacterium]|nr:type II secretion system F family protein [Planctomycetaceae bacterium]